MSIEINGTSMHPLAGVYVSSSRRDEAEQQAVEARINDAVNEYFNHFHSCRWLASLSESHDIVTAQWDGVPSHSRQTFLSDALAKAGFECVQKATAENSSCAGKNEDDVARRCLDRLSRHFDIHEQVWGTHLSGCRLRIDAIVKPKDTSEWANKDIALGIEFKNEGGGEYGIATNAYTKWLAQCADYANTNFDGFGFVFVFAYGGMARLAEGAGVITRVMGQLGVGELESDRRRGLSFTLCRDHRMWSEAEGVHEAKRWRLERKFGSK